MKSKSKQSAKPKSGATAVDKITQDEKPEDKRATARETTAPGKGRAQ